MPKVCHIFVVVYLYKLKPLINNLRQSALALKHLSRCRQYSTDFWDAWETLIIVSEIVLLNAPSIYSILKILKLLYMQFVLIG